MVQAYLACNVKGAELFYFKTIIYFKIIFYFNSYFILIHILFYITIVLYRVLLIIIFSAEPFIRRKPIWF